MVSITSLEFSYTHMPKSMKSIVMSFYLLSVALGNEFTAVVNWTIQRPDGTSRLPGANYYWFFAGMMAIAAVVYVIMAMGVIQVNLTWMWCPNLSLFKELMRLCRIHSRRDLVVMLGFIVLLPPATSWLSAADKSEKLLRHMVLYQFKPGLSAAQTKEVIDAFVALPKAIPTIVDFEHGPNVSQEGKSDGLTYGFVVTFNSQQDLENYIKHPVHQAYVDVVKNRREKVVVFDYWTGD